MRGSSLIAPSRHPVQGEDVPSSGMVELFVYLFGGLPREALILMGPRVHCRIIDAGISRQVGPWKIGRLVASPIDTGRVCPRPGISPPGIHEGGIHVDVSRTGVATLHSGVGRHHRPGVQVGGVTPSWLHDTALVVPDDGVVDDGIGFADAPDGFLRVHADGAIGDLWRGDVSVDSVASWCVVSDNESDDDGGR